MRRVRIRGLAPRLAIVIGGAGVLVYLAVFAYNAQMTRGMIIKDVERYSMSLAAQKRAEIDAVLGPVETTARDLARRLSDTPPPREEIERLLCTVVQSEWTATDGRRLRPIYGSAVAFEPTGSASTLERVASYCHQHENGVRVRDLSEGGYDYEDKDWYRDAVGAQKGIWSEPYVDEGGGNIDMVTFSVPFFRAGHTGRVVAGVATADVGLDWLQAVVSETRVGERDFIVVANQSGGVMAHSRLPETVRERKTIADLVAEYPQLRTLPERMARTKGIVAAESPDLGAVWIAFGPLINGWSLAVVFNQEEMLEGANSLRMHTLLLGLGGAVVLVGVIAWLARSIARPVSQLAEAADRIADDDLDVPLPEVVTGDEIETLARSFSQMRDSLKRLIAEEVRAAADKERHESDMRIARQIQMGIVPSSFERIIGDAPVEIAATLLPARGVGGDLYDAFLLGPGRLCIVAGDVSGKGIPAAMFMAMATTALRSIAREVDEPGQMLARLNDQLAEENPSQTFLTVFCGVLDIASGRLSYASGGHTNPVLLRDGDAPCFTVSDAGTLVGCVPELVFPSGSIQLRTNDVVVLYTDGVTEALNERDELFGEERLLESFRERSGRSAQGVVDELVAAVREFEGNAPQADDIGILVLRYAQH